VLTLPPSIRIYLAVEPIDLRRGHDGLSAVVQGQWRMDLFAGHLFVFLGRRRESRPLFARLPQWGRRHNGQYNPRSGMAKAINYLIKNFRELGRFLRFASIPPDNNVAEASLRPVAILVSLCTSSSSTWNLEGSIVAGNATRASRTFSAAA
jgi:hypothetical protein